jgi:PKD repeat protein
MDSEYAPIIVWFDGSKSSVRDSNIVKFTWDYWDWIIEERDAVIQWHKYVEAGEYDVKLIVTTQDWKSYSKTKRLILKPIPQSVKISTSMKRAPIWQWIDFISSGSEWQISSYVWDFWDGDISTQANPTHAFSKAWKYKVTLKLEFVNRNILEENVEIEVY